MTDSSDKQSDREAEPETHAEAVSRIRGDKLPKPVEPNVKAEEAPGALRPKKGNG